MSDELARWMLEQETRRRTLLNSSATTRFLWLEFNAALAEFDLFAEAISQRSESEVGVWLSGLDVAAQDLLTLRGGYYHAPPAICLLHRGLGGAIRRARARLPGGGNSPTAIIRIPRERMIGFGIASSLAHEVGHQAAALLDLVPSLPTELTEVQRRAPSAEQPAWALWPRWISEIIADVWAISRIGISSTLGLIGTVTLPRHFVFRVGPDDPHPFPWIRVQLSCAIGDALYPHIQWSELAATWRSLYPARLSPEQEDRVLGRLITLWALKSTLDVADMCAAAALPGSAPARVRAPVFLAKPAGAVA